MATIELNPSGYTGLSNLTTSSSYPISNGYDGTDSSTYARLSLSTSSTGYLYFTFDTSGIPSVATIQSITGSVKVRVSSTSRVTSTVCQLYTGTTAKGSNVTFASTSSTNVVTLSPGSSWTRSELDDLRLRIGGTGSSSSQSKYIYFYGAEITITYVTASHTVTTTLTGSGTISPSGATTAYEGEDFELTITPTNTSDAVTASKDGVDITSSLVRVTGETVTVVPNDATTSSIQSGASYMEYAVGHSAENPSSSGTSSNAYAASGSTGYAEYSFDFSDIPSGVEITAIEVRCYGHRENSTIDSTHVSQCAIYNGSTAISEAVDFPSTSNSVITLTATTIPSSLSSVTVRHFVGYYGGLVLGISFDVTYEVDGVIYTYTYTVDGDATIAVTIGGGGSTTQLYIKENGSWVTYSKLYRKVNGSWTEVADPDTVLSTSAEYLWKS